MVPPKRKPEPVGARNIRRKKQRQLENLRRSIGVASNASNFNLTGVSGTDADTETSFAREVTPDVLEEILPDIDSSADELPLETQHTSDIVLEPIPSTSDQGKIFLSIVRKTKEHGKKHDIKPKKTRN